jgi:hypothetical protein
MVVKEAVKLDDGRELTIGLSEEEHTYLLSYAVNHLIAQGVMVLGQVDGPEVIGTEEAVDEYNEKEKQKRELN